MNRRAFALQLALAASAALAWAGDEPTTYEITWRSRWKVGQTATVTEHETSDLTATRDGSPFKSTHDVFDAAYVVRCDELDAKGDGARWTVFVRSWRKTVGDVTDETIAGLRVAVVGKVWSLPEGRTAGPLAKKWLDRRFARVDDSPLSDLAPPRLAVGETWRPDPKAVAQAFAKSMDSPAFDPAGVEMEIRLVSVEGAPPDAKGRFELKIHLPIGSDVPGMPEGAVVLPGSAAEVVGERSGPLTTSTMLGTERLDMTMRMDVEVTRQGQKRTVSTKTRSIREKSAVAGGEIPEPPAPPK